MGEEKKSRLPDYSVLDGHERNRKKLVPPIMGLTGMRSVSTLDSILPEILWVGAILDFFGTRDGIQITSEILQRLWEKDEKTNWYRFTEICRNSRIFSDVVGEVAPPEIREVFASFKEVYSVAGLEWSASELDSDSHKQRICRAVSNYANRFEQPYLTALSTIIYSMGLAGKMRFATGTLPDIEAIVSDWGTDNAEMAACSVRACSLAFFPQDQTDESDAWCRQFWRINFQISECRL